METRKLVSIEEKTNKELLDYIKLVNSFHQPKKKGFVYRSIEELLLKNAEFNNNSLSKIPIELKKFYSFTPIMKACYANSQKLNINSGGKIKYYEGYIFSVIPIPHAWNVINGKVFDITANHFNLNMKSYFGVEIKIETILSQIEKFSIYNSILFDYSRSKEILKTGKF